MNKKHIVTHSSRFHADDVCAVATLMLVFGNDVVVTRTRDIETIEKADIVVDVGGVYDTATLRFDHHQKTFSEARVNGIPYASFGLVWKHYGEQLCGSKEAADILDTKIVQPIDASDNGVQTYEPVFEGVHPYVVNTMLYTFMPSWKESIDLDDSFMQAVQMMKTILEREVVRIKDALEAQAIIEDRYQQATDKTIIVFEKTDNFADEDIQRVLLQYPEPKLHIRYRHEDDNWSAKAVWGGDGVFTNRIDFPESWAALEHEALQEETDVADAIFCHRGRFLCVAKSFEGIMLLAQQAVSSSSVDKM